MKTSDYNTILLHYEVDIPKTLKEKKELVEKILANKMCRCIKAVQKSSKLEEPAAIAICNKSIFQKRGLKYNKIKCIKRAQIIENKKTKKKLIKTKKQLTFKKKKTRKNKKVKSKKNK